VRCKPSSKLPASRRFQENRENPHWREFLEFNREGFRRYVRHYVDELHKFDPGFQVTSNWLFSDLMPEPVSTNVDFLSGDHPQMDSVRAARLSVRWLVAQGKPWDLMAWVFGGKENSDPARSYKTTAACSAFGSMHEADDFKDAS